MRRILPAMLLVGALVASPLPVSGHGGDGHCDFDGDGYDDAAIGATGEAVGFEIAAGAVNVLYGSVDKLTAAGDQLWTQDEPGVDDVSEFEDWFGRAVDCGDFDGDGYDDLVISVPGETVAGAAGTGAVHVLPGSPTGLTATDSLFLYRDAAGVAGQGEHYDRFGWSLAVGDFDGDGKDDLAVGAYADDVGGVLNAGSIQVFYGSAGGLSTGNDEVWHRGKDGIKGALEEYAHFGYTLAAGDFNGDGRDDLAIGSPDDDIGMESDAGSVSVLYGSASGLTKRDDLFHRDRPGIRGVAAGGDGFGRSLAAGDFDGDGFDELAIGVPNDTVAGMSYAGSVHVLSGTEDGLTPAGDKIWHRGKKGIAGAPGISQLFGWSLTTGHFDAGKYVDLAVGIPRDARQGVVASGSVQVIYGSTGGLDAAGDQIWHQGKKGIKGANEMNDYFGYSISSGDFNGNSRDDLLIGVPMEDGATTDDSGKASVIYGRKDGLDSRGDQSWSQDTPGVLGAIEDDDYMGWSVSGSSFEE